MLSVLFESENERAGHLKAALHNKTLREVIGSTSTNDIREEIQDEDVYRKLLDEEARRNFSILRGDMTGRVNYLEALEDKFGTLNVNQLKEKCSVVDSLYYRSHFKFVNKKAEIYDIEIDNQDSVPEAFRNERASDVLEQDIFGTDKDYLHAISETGNGTTELNNNPLVRFIKVEDETRLIVGFWMVGKTDYYFDSIEQEHRSIQRLGEAVCRLHLDKGFMELQSHKTKKEQDQKVIQEIERLFNDNIKLNRCKIDPDIVDEKEEEFDQVTHEKREGAETTFALTRLQEEYDIRESDLREMALTFARNRIYGKMPIGAIGGDLHSVSIFVKHNHFRANGQKLLPQERSAIIEQLYDYLWIDQ